MGVVRTKSGLASTTRTTRDQLIIFIDIITKNHFLEGRRRDWSESDSSIQPLYGKFHALSPVSAGRWGVTRERCGEIGMWRKQVRAPASSHTNLEPLVIILFYFILVYFIIIYFIIYLLNERKH